MVGPEREFAQRRGPALPDNGRMAQIVDMFRNQGLIAHLGDPIVVAHSSPAI